MLRVNESFKGHELAVETKKVLAPIEGITYVVSQRVD